MYHRHKCIQAHQLTKSKQQVLSCKFAVLFVDDANSKMLMKRGTHRLPVRGKLWICATSILQFRRSASAGKWRLYSWTRNVRLYTARIMYVHAAPCVVSMYFVTLLRSWRLAHALYHKRPVPVSPKQFCSSIYAQAEVFTSRHIQKCLAPQCSIKNLASCKFSRARRALWSTRRSDIHLSMLARENVHLTWTFSLSCKRRGAHDC